MIKTVIEIEGMSCGMCEAHINETIRRAFDIKSVKSSHKKNQTEIVSAESIDGRKLRDVICPTGYVIKSIHSEVFSKKGLFW